MKLRELIAGADCAVRRGAPDTEIAGIAYDSRRVTPGGLFVCLPGAELDGHQYIEGAVSAGAAAVLTLPGHRVPEGAVHLESGDTRRALAQISCTFFRNPSYELNVVGITGTKGKTTTAYMLRKLLEGGGRRVGLIGTVGAIISDRHEKTENTTPESYELQRLLREMADAGLDTAVVEVSSQGLKTHRVEGTRFTLGIFTNLARDHIGEREHADMAEYAACKARLFRMCDHALVNADADGWEDVLAGHNCTVSFYGIEARTFDLWGEGLRCVMRSGVPGVEFTLRTPAEAHPVTVGLPGRYSVYNALAAWGAAAYLGMAYRDMAGGLEDIRVPGRCQIALQGYEPKRLIVLFGCGGGRDRARRLAMGEMAGRYADLSILTEDNPRDEEPQAIIQDILRGMRRAGGRYEIIPHRREAILHMLELARFGDICAIIGKGHETYQEIMGERHYFSEQEIVTEWARRQPAAK